MGKLKVFIHTVGCRANQADSAVLQAHLDPAVAIMGAGDDADIFVINTCCVTTEAERDCKKAARRLLRENPAGKVLFTGCAVSAFADFSKEFKERVLVAGGGATSPAILGGWLNEYSRKSGDVVPLSAAKLRENDYFAEPDEAAFQTVANVQGRTRALLKIQNGCTHNCTYCIVPKARGKEQSMPVDMVLKQVTALKDAGAMELVFTGVQIGAWGKDLPGTPTIAALLDEAAGVFAPGRIRLSSIEPWSVDEALIDVMAGNDRICRHLHMPLQSGDDGVLADMKRGYTAAEWLEKVRMAKAKIRDVSVGTDVICGFPTEDERAFQNSLDVVAASEVAYVHGFSYSRRPGTIAAQKWGENRQIARERVRQLRALGEKLQQRFVAGMMGKSVEILVEDGHRGITDNFLSIRLDDGGDQTLVSGVLFRCMEQPDSVCAKINPYVKRHFSDADLKRGN